MRKIAIEKATADIHHPAVTRLVNLVKKGFPDAQIIPGAVRDTDAESDNRYYVPLKLNPEQMPQLKQFLVSSGLRDRGGSWTILPYGGKLTPTGNRGFALFKAKSGGIFTRDDGYVVAAPPDERSPLVK